MPLASALQCELSRQVMLLMQKQPYLKVTEFGPTKKAELNMSDRPNLDIRLSDAAASRIREITTSPDKQFLRVAVKGGGCSGFSYVFDFAKEPNQDDVVIERDGARVLVDEMSVPFLGGAELDFVDNLIGATFQIHNPNATAACGCGTSFSV